MQFACLEATLAEVATDEAFAQMEAGAAHLVSGLSAAIEAAGLPWHAIRVGARVEFICAPGPLRNGTDAAAAHHPQVESAVHLGLLNRALGAVLAGAVGAILLGIFLISASALSPEFGALAERSLLAPWLVDAWRALTG